MAIPYVWVAPDAVTAHVYATPACQSSSSGNSGFVASRRPCQPASQPAVVVVVYRRRLESASATGTRLRLSAVRSMPAVGIQLQHDHFTYTPSIWIFVYMSTYISPVQGRWHLLGGYSCIYASISSRFASFTYLFLFGFATLQFGLSGFLPTTSTSTFFVLWLSAVEEKYLLFRCI